MLFVIDNFDSFTFNLVQYCRELGVDVVVQRNTVTLDDIRDYRPAGLLVSPGPCTPDEAGISVEAIQYFSGRIPVFGVCLGHQALAQAFGGTVIRANHLMHGKTSLIQHNGRDGLFTGVPTPFQATRYHSLIVDAQTLPASFEVIASVDDTIMALRHKPTGAAGVQFHPESILTPFGKQILANFLHTVSTPLRQGA